MKFDQHLWCLSQTPQILPNLWNFSRLKFTEQKGSMKRCCGVNCKQTVELGFQTLQKNWYMWCSSQIPNSTLSRRMFLLKFSPQMYALFCCNRLLRSRAIFKVAPQLDKNMHCPKMHCSHMGPHLGKRSPLGTFFSCCVPIFFILG